MKSRRGLSIFAQTLILLLASLLASQLVSTALFLSMRAPRPDVIRLGDLAEVLGEGHKRRERLLTVTPSPAPPAPSAELTSDPALTADLAERLGVAPARVRLFFEPDQRRSILEGGRGGGGEERRGRRVPMRRGEPLFFNSVVAGLDTGAGWRVAQTAPKPFLNAWQRRILLWLGLSALVMTLFAWWFARRLARPIQNFALAADRLGADPNAPRVPEEGPRELRVAANALNRMQGRLADYVAERTAMIGAIAHDLRTPLARIAFRIEAAPEALRDKVQDDVEQMRAMIAATIGFVKGTTQHGEAQAVPLAALLDKLVAAEREVGRPVTAGGLEPLTVWGDPIALARLFQNLVDNGVAYGGAVTVSLVRESGEAVVRVADAGPGLPPETIERLFQPFERGDPSRSRETGGIGLGLTIARAIAQGHGGTLILQNRTAGGAEAVARLPIRA